MEEEGTIFFFWQIRCCLKCVSSTRSQVEVFQEFHRLLKQGVQDLVDQDPEKRITWEAFAELRENTIFVNARLFSIIARYPFVSIYAEFC